MIDFAQARAEMVESQLRRRGISDTRTLEVFSKIPREKFVAAELADAAYDDNPLPIGSGQTISQPYMVARMTELLRLAPESKVLEVGSGCGYQTAVLAELADKVYSIEIVYELMASARARLRELGYENVKISLGDGWTGLPEMAPFDAILVAAAAPKEAPKALLDQLAPGGRCVIPLGRDRQRLYLYTKTDKGIVSEEMFAVRFVPLVDPS